MFVRKAFRFLVSKIVGRPRYTVIAEKVNLLVAKLGYSKYLDIFLEKSLFAKAIIIYLPTIDWGYLFQRPQQLALAFEQQNYLYFYCTSNLNEDLVYGFQQVADNLYITNQVHFLLEKLGLLKNTFIYVSWTVNKKYIDQYKIPMNRVIYDYIDELDVFSQYGEQMKKDHEFLVKEAAVVIATADKLYEEVSRIRSDCLLVPNAVNPEDFVIKTNIQPPSDIQLIVDKKHPIIGYYGALACWLDYELLMFLAESRPDYEIVLIGPDYDGSKNKYFLSKYSNIACLGSKAYQDLPKYAHQFDIAIIPFLVNKITSSTSPIKLFEYMALKKPIVTTDLHECQKYEGVIISHTYEEFVKNVDYALTLKNNQDYLSILDSEVRKNTWTNRVKQISSLIEARVVQL